MGQGAGSSLRRPGIMVRQRLQMLGTAELKCAVVGESDGSCQCPGQMGREGQSPGPPGQQEAQARHSPGLRTARTGRKEDYAAGAGASQPGPDSRAKEAITWSHGSKKQAGGNFFEPKISFLSRLHYPAPPLPPPPSPPKELKAWTSGGCAPKTRQL